MNTNTISLNPFSLMMEPELVLRAMERSQSLRSLRRHQLRPLDKPLIPFCEAPTSAKNGAQLAAPGSAFGELED